MSTGFLKKPSRPPPPPPIDHHQSYTNGRHHHSFSNSLLSNIASPHIRSGSATLAAPSHRKSLSSSRSRSDYIKISECHTGLPDDLKPPKLAGFKSRASTSFSSTLKPSPTSSYYLQSSHQKSRSLTENHIGSSYLYLDLTSSDDKNSKHNGSLSKNPYRGVNNSNGESLKIGNIGIPQHAATEYKTVDFQKTETLYKCKVQRTSGRGQL